MVGEDVLVAKFRLQVAGSTLGEGLKLQRGGLSGSLKNLNPAVAWKHLGQLLQRCWSWGWEGEGSGLHGCPACEPSAETQLRLGVKDAGEST